MKYESVVRNVCGDYWKNSTADERDGAYGIAMVMAYMEGCHADVSSLARYLAEQDENGDWDVRARDLDIAFRRLQLCGVFSSRFDVLNDHALNGWTNARLSRTAWCQIAGMSSGFIGAGSFLSRTQAKE